MERITSNFYTKIIKSIFVLVSYMTFINHTLNMTNRCTRCPKKKRYTIKVDMALFEATVVLVVVVVLSVVVVVALLIVA